MNNEREFNGWIRRGDISTRIQHSNSDPMQMDDGCGQSNSSNSEPTSLFFFWMSIDWLITLRMADGRQFDKHTEMEAKKPTETDSVTLDYSDNTRTSRGAAPGYILEVEGTYCAVFFP